jgi:predicted membrane protein
METQNEQMEEFRMRFEKKQRRGKIFGGLLVVTIGSLFLARELGAAIPAWIFTWKMLVIGIGIVGLLKNSFMNFKWWLVVAVASAFLFNDMNPEMRIEPLVWPVLAILAGLVMIFKPRRKFGKHGCGKHYSKHRWNKQNWQKHSNIPDKYKPDLNDEEYNQGNKINAVNIFGGEIVTVFGGSEINLMQADINGEARLEVVQVFGGTVLIVPSNWKIQSEIITVMGGIDDKRPVQHDVNNQTEKVLALYGTIVFGGIEIKSH